MSANKGLDSFFDVLAVINDPGKYQAKVEELKKITNDYAVVVESVVKLSEVNDYTQNIKKSKDEAEAALMAAKVEAENIVSKAKDDADAMKAINKVTKAKLDERQASLNEKEKSLAEKDSMVMAMKTDLDKTEKILKEKEVRLAALAEELDAKKAKLMAAIA
jgi:chromosome segregation ATPase